MVTSEGNRLCAWESVAILAKYVAEGLLEERCYMRRSKLEADFGEVRDRAGLRSHMWLMKGEIERSEGLRRGFDGNLAQADAVNKARVVSLSMKSPLRGLRKDNGRQGTTEQSKR